MQTSTVQPAIDMVNCSLDQFLQVAMQQRLTPMLLIPTDIGGMRVNICTQLEEVKYKLRLSVDQLLSLQELDLLRDASKLQMCKNRRLIGS
ncbi:hypothetical protein MIR68_001300 [Amoeboaphelidium protococcarum]|nr:hypothetical protein MIR68_001300 [Amoeboaphelidium protococcarum]